jgi:hypothetical protein
MAAAAPGALRGAPWSRCSARRGPTPARPAAPGRAPLRAHAAGGAGAPRTVKELPIFPLNVVALPHATVPLMIFEPRCGPAAARRAAHRRRRRDRWRAAHAAGARSAWAPAAPLTPALARPHQQCNETQSYRVLFNTLMDGEADIEEGLVQKDSPFAGTRKFGMCFVDGGSGRMATCAGGAGERGRGAGAGV